MIRRYASIAGILILGAVAFGCQTKAAGPGRWWKGNLHTHSLWSDGDDYPEMIVAWYKDRGYDFVALSDHNVLAEGERWIPVAASGPGRAAYDAYVARFGKDWVEIKEEDGVTRVRLQTLAAYRPLFEEEGRFLILQSEEISDRFAEKELHVNATNIREVIAPQGGGSVREVLQNNIDAVLAQRARTGAPIVPHVNHPNYGWAVTAEDLIALEGERFFEVYNGHPLVHNEGDSLHPGTDRLWDIVLTGRLAHGDPILYGLATDDAHHYHAFDPTRSNPGRGWVMVRAPELTAEALLAALEAGDFYASTGVVLEDIRFDGRRLQLLIRGEEGVSYATQFIGTRRDAELHSGPVAEATGAPVTRHYSDGIGVVLEEAKGTAPVYEVKGDELYVRAKVISSKPRDRPTRVDEVEMAWVQPFTL